MSSPTSKSFETTVPPFITKAPTDVSATSTSVLSTILTLSAKSKRSSSSIHVRTPSFVSPSKVTAMSVPAVPSPIVRDVPNSFVT